MTILIVLVAFVVMGRTYYRSWLFYGLMRTVSCLEQRSSLVRSGAYSLNTRAR